MNGKHLWEVDHPYYMNEGNYYKAGEISSYETFADFLAEWGDEDLDYNRIHRFDWQNWQELDDSADVKPEGTGTLQLFYVMQRKARLYSVDIKVTAEDEPAVIEFLKPHYERERAIWEPFSSAIPEVTE